MNSEDNNISGNKGEWSELYVFLKVLSDGYIFGADGNIQKRPEICYNINKVIRNEGSGPLTYDIKHCSDSIAIYDGEILIEEIKTEIIASECHSLFTQIVLGSGSSFSIPKTEEFMHVLKCAKLKAPSTDKTDILLEICEPKTNMCFIEGFSIKSMLGSPSTLINASAATNIIYSLDGGMTQEIADKANEIFSSDSKTKVMDGLFLLRSKEIALRYSDTNNDIFSINLTLVDSYLPMIVAEMVKLHYIDGISSIKEQMRVLCKRNPLNYRCSDTVPYYSFKIKKLLAAFALGMKPSKQWSGKEEANGGYIIVKKDGDILCYHIFDRGNFEDYLLNNTKTETASTDRHNFAKVYKENGEYKIKLNFQVRFT